MSEINVYQQYFGAECVFSGRPRHAAQVLLTASSGEGMIKYEVRVSFFPHDAPDDFAVSYDAEAACVLYDGKGRRSKKREKLLLEQLRESADGLAGELGGTIDWDSPLIEARFG